VHKHQSLVWPCCVLLVAVWAPTGTQSAPQPTPQTYKGLAVTVSAVSRAVNVSLSDCPPGANSVRGVIKPGDANEFASVKVDFNVLPAFKPGTLGKPILYDDAGKAYNTAQAFGEIGSVPAFSCTFSFRVPKGVKLTRLAFDTVSFDLGAVPQ
jgi:hypothetical protein